VDCDLAGLAKRDEEIYLPGRADPVVLPRDSPALRVLVAVRDETHRFATGLSRKLRGDSLRFGLLETIEGVGPERAKKLMKAFGSAEALAAADIAAIAKAGGTGAALAAKIKAALSPASPAASPPSTLTRSSTLKRSSTSSTSSTSPTSS
jgi:excinuclease ABC subunit C